MKNVVMGTAGHIDHGKTSLVKRLTGIDTDRLEEEKRRGMTIELGFANLHLPSGKNLSIVDVPGHEKFIKSMVAGVSGIDFVVLVIAADEGTTPQTKEHLDILSLLNVENGVVALTKVDLVDSEWLSMVKNEIIEVLKDSSLKNINIIPVSSKSGEGIEELLTELDKLTEYASEGQGQEIFRLPIDRVFTIGGHGTVVTGTVVGGEIKKGDKIRILPSNMESKIRGIQVHGKAVDIATNGDRCALNLMNIEKDAIERGQVIISNDWMRPSKLMDAVIFTVKEATNLKHNERVHVHIGTQEVLARVRLIGTEEIKADSKGFLQLKFEEPVVALRGDRFIIRSYSPTRTIGGGKILLHHTNNRGRFLKENINELELLHTGALKEQIEYLLNENKEPIEIDEICNKFICNSNEALIVLEELIAQNKVIIFSKSYLARSIYDQYIKTIKYEINMLNRAYPYRFDIDREEFKNKLFKDVENKVYIQLLEKLLQDKIIELNNNFISLSNKEFVAKIMKNIKVTNILNQIINLQFNVKTIKQLETLYTERDSNEVLEILNFLIKTNKVVNLGDTILISSEYFRHSLKHMQDIVNNNEELTVSSLRDKIGCGRKTAMSILEYCDNVGITKRQGDSRIIVASEAKPYIGIKSVDNLEN